MFVYYKDKDTPLWLGFNDWLLVVVSGAASMTVPVYVAEAAPAHLRGQLVTLNNVFITGGQFVAAVVDGLLSETREGWRLVHTTQVKHILHKYDILS